MMTQLTLNRPVKVLLVDDHRVFAEVLAMRLRTEAIIDTVEVAFSLGGARAAVNTFRPDLVLLDFQLADELGLDLFSDLGQLPQPPNVLMLSGTDDTVSIVQALDAGAQGWVSKTTRFQTLVFATKEVLRGHMYLAPPTIKPVILHLLNAARVTVSEPSFVDELSPRELEVLRCLVAGMSRSEVAAHLFVSVNTVRTHVQNLLRHADRHSTLALVSLARDLGVQPIDGAQSSWPSPQRRSSE